jgi:hypothetical protein
MIGSIGSIPIILYKFGVNGNKKEIEESQFGIIPQFMV